MAHFVDYCVCISTTILNITIILFENGIGKIISSLLSFYSKCRFRTIPIIYRRPSFPRVHANSLITSNRTDGEGLSRFFFSFLLGFKILLLFHISSVIAGNMWIVNKLKWRRWGAIVGMIGELWMDVGCRKALRWFINHVITKRHEMNIMWSSLILEL